MVITSRYKRRPPKKNMALALTRRAMATVPGVRWHGPPNAARQSRRSVIADEGGIDPGTKGRTASCRRIGHRRLLGLTQVTGRAWTPSCVGRPLTDIGGFLKLVRICLHRREGGFSGRCVRVLRGAAALGAGTVRVVRTHLARRLGRLGHYDASAGEAAQVGTVE